MSLIVFDSLTRAIQRARNRPANTIALILGLEGARYYVFFSQPNLGQLMNRVAVNKINVAMEIEHFGQNVGHNLNIRPSDIVAARGIALAFNHNQRRDRSALLTPLIVEEAKARQVDQQAGHAEMFMIAAWRECMQDFIAHRDHAPRRGEVFLTHSPCRQQDEKPSPPMSTGGIEYPSSCRAKLYTFFKRNHSVQWKIWYNLRFGTAEAMDDAALANDFPGIVIGRMPPDIYSMF